MPTMRTLQSMLNASSDKRLKQELNDVFVELAEFAYVQGTAVKLRIENTDVYLLGRDGLIETLKEQLFKAHQSDRRDSEAVTFLKAHDAYRKELNELAEEAGDDAE